MSTYAESEDKDGKALAQALLYTGAGITYLEPHAVPVESSDSRLMNSQNTENSIEQAQSYVNIYPNPTNTGVNLNYSSKTKETVKVELRDLVGRAIYTNFISEVNFEKYIPLDHLSNGLYLITVTRGKEVIYKEKLIKE